MNEHMYKACKVCYTPVEVCYKYVTSLQKACDQKEGYILVTYLLQACCILFLLCYILYILSIQSIDYLTVFFEANYV